jgi:membrane protein
MSRSPVFRKTMKSLQNPVTTNPVTQQREVAAAEPPA